MGILRWKAEILGVMGAAALFFCLLPVLGFILTRVAQRTRRIRLETQISVQTHSRRILGFGSVLNTLDRWSSKLYFVGPGRIIFSWWCDAGFGSGSLLFTLTWLGICFSGGLIYRFTALNFSLSAFLTVIFLIAFFGLIFFKAKINRELFQNQLPDTLDRLAGSLQAGFSLPQAVGFIAANLPEPSAEEMFRIHQQIQLGFSVVEALEKLHQRHPVEEVRLLIEGVSLQRQVGGNLTAMMFELADLVRTKVALKNQVQTLTAQGRVSAVVLALLIPVSLGLLSLFPGYIDALIDTQIGNLVLIGAGCLELIGAAIIFQLIKVET